MRHPFEQRRDLLVGPGGRLAEMPGGALRLIGQLLRPAPGAPAGDPGRSRVRRTRTGSAIAERQPPVPGQCSPAAPARRGRGRRPGRSGGLQDVEIAGALQRGEQQQLAGPRGQVRSDPGCDTGRAVRRAAGPMAVRECGPLQTSSMAGSSSRASGFPCASASSRCLTRGASSGKAPSALAATVSSSGRNSREIRPACSGVLSVSGRSGSLEPDRGPHRRPRARAMPLGEIQPGGHRRSRAGCRRCLATGRRRPRRASSRYPQCLCGTVGAERQRAAVSPGR